MIDRKGMRVAMLFATVVCAFAAEVHARKEYSIGTRGFVVDLDDSYERAQGDRSLGKDQFRTKKGGQLVYCGFMESPLLIAGEAVHRNLLDSVVVNLGKMGTDLEIEVPFSYRTAGDLEYGCVVSSMQEGSVKLVRQTGILSSGGAGYVMFTWAGSMASREVDEVAQEVWKRVRRPRPGTVAGARFEPVRHETTLLDRVVGIACSPVTLTLAGDRAEGRIDLRSKGADVLAYVLPLTVDGGFSDAFRLVLDAIGSPASRGIPDPIREFAIDGRPARSIVVPFASDATKFIDCTVVEIGTGEFLDVRIQYPTPQESLAEFRRELLASITVRDLPRLELEFVPGPAESLPPIAFPAAKEAMVRSQSLGALAGPYYDSTACADGSVLLSMTESVWRLSSDLRGITPVLEGRPAYRYRVTTPYRGGFLTSEATGIAMVRDGVKTDESVPAELQNWVEAGSGALIGTRAVLTAATIPGITINEWSARDVVKVDPDGTVTSLLPLGMVRVGDLALDSTGSMLWVYFSERNEVEIGEISRLSRIDLATGVSEPIGEWRYISEISSSDRGVLVTGQTRTGRVGIHRVGTDGRIELLLGGRDFVGVTEREGRLVYVSYLALDGEPGGVAQLRSVDLEAIRDLGMAATPPSLAELSAVAARAFGSETDPWGSLVLHTRERLDDFLSRAESAAEELGLPPLPDRCDQIDEILRGGFDAREVDDRSLVLLSALCLRAMSDSRNPGVSFVPAAEQFDLRVKARRRDFPADSSFAFCCDVVELVLSNFEADGKSWTDLRGIVAVGERVPVFVGVDPESLRLAVAGAAPPDFFGRLERLLVESDDPARIDEIARELVARPKAIHLQRRVYERVARSGDAKALERLVRTILTATGDGTETDRLFLVRSMLAGAEDDAARAGVVAEARAAVERFANSVPLWIALGDAYRESGMEHAIHLSRLAYRGARERDGDKEWAEQIDRALAGLPER